MDLRPIKLLTIRDIILLSIFTLLSIWVYVGFYFPGSYMLSYGTFPTKILWVLRVVLPFLYAGLIILYVNVRRQRVSRKELVLLFVATALGLYICYGIADGFYQQCFDSHRREYHPFLRLVPPFYSRMNLSFDSSQRCCLFARKPFSIFHQ